MKRTIAGLTAALAAALLAHPIPAHAGPAPVPASPALKYVAMGDSYSAGWGNVPLVPNAYAQPCGQSTRNLGHLIAARLGARLTDVSCGGAVAAGFWNAQYPTAPAQFKALTPDTDLVTFSIGGNDHVVFPGATVSCSLVSLATLGLGSPCTAFKVDRWKKAVDASRPDITRAITGVRARAPRAQVAVIGYPLILPPTRGCFPSVPIAPAEVPKLYDLQQHLNAMLREIAEAAGATFVDMGPVSAGHDACQREPDRWVEPILLPRGGYQFVHPNARGEAAMADQTLAALGLG